MRFHYPKLKISVFLLIVLSFLITTLPSPAKADPCQAIHTVQSGDTLAGLAQQYYGDASQWGPICYIAILAGVLQDCDNIYPGQVLCIPYLDPPPSCINHNAVAGDTLWGLALQYYGDQNKWGGIWYANANNIGRPGDDFYIPSGISLCIPAQTPPSSPPPPGCKALHKTISGNSFWSISQQYYNGDSTNWEGICWLNWNVIGTGNCNNLPTNKILCIPDIGTGAISNSCQSQGGTCIESGWCSLGQGTNVGTFDCPSGNTLSGSIICCAFPSPTTVTTIPPIPPGGEGDCDRDEQCFGGRICVTGWCRYPVYDPGTGGGCPAWSSMCDSENYLTSQQLADLVRGHFTAGLIATNPNLNCAQGRAEDNRQVAYAVAMAESSGDTTACYGSGQWGNAGTTIGCLNPPPGRYDTVECSVGLWQVFWLCHSTIRDRMERLFDPETAADTANEISGDGTDWTQWSTYNNCDYEEYMPNAAGALGGTMEVLTKVNTDDTVNLDHAFSSFDKQYLSQSPSGQYEMTIYDNNNIQKQFYDNVDVSFSGYKGTLFTKVPWNSDYRYIQLTHNGNFLTKMDLLDSDSDGVPNVVDNCPSNYNPLQSDFDKDGLADACDPNPSTYGIYDTDSDGITDAGEVYGVTLPAGVKSLDDTTVVYTNPRNSDTDGDGCSDGKELGPDQLMGGRRDPTNPWDFFDPYKDPDDPGDQSISDIVAVVNQYYKNRYLDSPPYQPNPPNPSYNINTDRGVAADGQNGPNPWNLGPPDGRQDIVDIINAVDQYYHDCTATGGAESAGISTVSTQITTEAPKICPDVNRDKVINETDASLVLDTSLKKATCPICDLNNDTKVDGKDVMISLGTIGKNVSQYPMCTYPKYCPDINKDKMINKTDVSIVQKNYYKTNCPPYDCDLDDDYRITITDILMTSKAIGKSIWEFPVCKK